MSPASCVSTIWDNLIGIGLAGRQRSADRILLQGQWNKPYELVGIKLGFGSGWVSYVMRDKLCREG